MNLSHHLRVFALLSPVVFTGVLVAQSSGGGTDCDQPSCSSAAVQTANSTTPDTETSSQPQIYAASLDGRSPIPLLKVPNQLLAGLTLSSGWDSNSSAGEAGVPSRFYVVSPYVALRLVTPQTQALLQYNLTVANYNTGSADQILHAGSAQYLRSISDRCALDVNAQTSYGSNGARLLSSQQTIIGVTFKVPVPKDYDSNLSRPLIPRLATEP